MKHSQTHNIYLTVTQSVPSAHTHLGVTMAFPLYLRLEVGGQPPKHRPPQGAEELGDSDFSKLCQTCSYIALQDDMISPVTKEMVLKNLP